MAGCCSLDSKIIIKIYIDVCYKEKMHLLSEGDQIISVSAFFSTTEESLFL